MASSYYATYSAILRRLIPLVMSVHVRGIEHISATGPCLLVSNHLSNADSFCLIASIPRPFYGMAKAELFEHWVVRRVIAGLEPIKVQRHGSDRQALRQAEDYLKQGRMLLLYAEGTRSKTGELQEGRAGMVFLAQRTGAPIVPIAISGTDKLFKRTVPWYRRAPVQITIGAPFQLADLGEIDRRNRHELAQAVMARVAALLPPAYQGVHRPDQPSGTTTLSKS
jgi:1-acyl-sn-glycerol-3-phosphate acyltransferase